MEDMEIKEARPPRFATGIKYGVLAAVVYVLLLLIRYLFCSGNPLVFSGTIFLSYLVIILFFVLAAVARKKELGGYADIKDLFGTIFIVILFSELAYSIFNYIYLNFIDPEFFNNFIQTTIEYVKKMGGNMDAVNQQMDKLQEQNKLSSSIPRTFSGMLTWIVVDSIIGIIVALIIRKPKPQF